MYINNLNVKEIDSSTLEEETCKKFNELQNLQSILRRLKLRLRDKDKNYTKYKRFHDNILSIIQFRVSNDTITRDQASENEIEYTLINENSIVINNEQLVLEDATHVSSPETPSSRSFAGDDDKLFAEHHRKLKSHGPEKSASTKEEGDIAFNVESINGQNVVKINDHVYLPVDYYNRLYLHQKKALNWLVKLHINNLGGILADDMGLGKTITILSLINSLIYSNNLILGRIGSSGSLGASSSHSKSLPSPDQLLRAPATPLLPTSMGDNVCRMLIVCNVTLIEQWRSEINKWMFNDIKLYILHSNYDVNCDYFAPSEDSVYHSSGPEAASCSSSFSAGHSNLDDGSIFINGESEHAVSYIVYLVGYEYLRLNVEYINNYDWSYLILDEGQKIRNPNALITLAVKTINTPHRIVISGSPIQNNLIELWSLIDFILPNYLGSLNAFIEEFVVPISGNSLNNRYINRLKLLILPYIFRTLKSGLGAKRDLLSAITSGGTEEAQVSTEEHDDLDDSESLFGSGPEAPMRSKRPADESSDKKEVELPNKVERIILCNLTVEQYKLYIDVLNKFKYSNKNFASRGYKLTRDVRKLIGKELTRDKHILKVISILRKICNHPQLLLKSPLPVPASSPTNSSLDSSLSPSSESTPGNSAGFSTGGGSVSSRNTMSSSSKLNVCLKIIGIWRDENCKILVFTQTISMLSIIYHELLRSYRSRQIAILHGKIGINARNKVIEDFRNDEDIFIMLLTTKVGGIGLNLTIATRIIIYDPDWNPMTDLQARERSYRIGQRKQVVIYRLITAHTIEEKIYQRQLYKCYLTNKILNYSNVMFYNKYINNLQYILSYPPPPAGVPSSNPLYRDFGSNNSDNAEYGAASSSEPGRALSIGSSSSKSTLGEDEDQFYRLLLNRDSNHHINSYIKYNDIINNIQESAENNNYPALVTSSLLPSNDSVSLSTGPSSVPPARRGLLARNMDRTVDLNKQLLFNLRGRNNKNIKYIITNQILHYFNTHAGQNITTNHLISYFKPILPDEYHKMFKSTLKQLCTLVKNDKSSHWKLNDKYINVLPNYLCTM